MPGCLLHVNAVMQCTHAAPVSTAPTQPRVLVNSQAVATVLNLLTVAGCPFQIPLAVGTKPQPCVRVQWTMTSARVLVTGQAALLQVSPGPGAGICQSVEQIPQGPPQVSAMQLRVLAS
jgi:hypothetical protein